MVAPEFRNPDLFELLPFREWIRHNMPPGRDGYVVEDLDLLVRVYGTSWETDSIGKFFLVEKKYGNAWPGYAQRMTFGLVNNLLRAADPESRRYKGYYVIQHTAEEWDRSDFAINGIGVSMDEFRRFLSLDDELLARISEHGRHLF